MRAMASTSVPPPKPPLDVPAASSVADDSASVAATAMEDAALIFEYAWRNIERAKGTRARRVVGPPVCVRCGRIKLNVHAARAWVLVCRHREHDFPKRNHLAFWCSRLWQG